MVAQTQKEVTPTRMNTHKHKHRHTSKLTYGSWEKPPVSTFKIEAVYCGAISTETCTADRRMWNTKK